MNNNIKQQTVADLLRDLKDAFIVGIINEYELAGKILNSIQYADLPKAPWAAGFDPDDDESERELDPLFGDERSQTESEAFRLAH